MKCVLSEGGTLHEVRGCVFNIPFFLKFASTVEESDNCTSASQCPRHAVKK